MGLFPMNVGGGGTSDIPVGTEFRTQCSGNDASVGLPFNVSGIKNARFISSSGYATIAIATEAAMTNRIATIPTYPSTIDVNVSDYSVLYLRNLNNQYGEIVRYTVL